MLQSAIIAARLLEADPEEDPWSFSVSVTNDRIEIENHSEPEGVFNDVSAELTVDWRVDIETRWRDGCRYQHGRPSAHD